MSYPPYMEWGKTVTVGTTLIEVISIELPIFVDKMSIEISNGGSDALNAFKVRKKSTRSATWRTIYNAATDWTSPSSDSHIKYAEGSPTALVGGAVIGFELIDISSWAGIQLACSVGANTSDITIKMGAGV